MTVAFRAALLTAGIAVGVSACTSGGTTLTQPGGRSSSAVSRAAVSATRVSPSTTTPPALAAAGRPVPAALLKNYRAGRSFFSKVVHHDGTADVELGSATTGAPLLSVLPSRHGRVFVVSVASLGPTRLLITYGTGENCSNGLADCGPLPNVCGGEVDVLDLPTGKLHQVWSFPRGVHVNGAIPSPDGADVAARVAPCQRSLADDYL